MRSHLLKCFVVLFSITTPIFSQSNLSSKSKVESLLVQMKEYVESEYFEKAFDVGKAALSLYETEIVKPDTLLGYIYNDLGNVCLDLGEYEKAGIYFEKNLILRKKIFEEVSIPVGLAYNSLGLYYDYSSEFEKAINHYEKACSIFKVLLPESISDLARSYFNMAICYAFLEDYQKAIQFSIKALDLDLQIYGVDHIEVAHDYHNLGILYNNVDNLEKAKSAFLECRRIFEKVGMSNDLVMARLIHNICKLHWKQGYYEKALIDLDQTLKIQLKVLPENDRDIIDSYRVIGYVNNLWGKYLKAISYLNTALDLSNTSSNITWEILYDIYFELSRSYYLNGNPKKAQTYLQKAITQTFPDTSLIATCTNAKKLDAWASLLVQRAAIAEAFYQQTEELEYLLSAKQDYTSALAIWEEQREGFYGDQSKKAWVDNRYGVFEKAIACHFSLAEVTGRQSYLEQAYDLAEQSRALLLLDALQESKAAHFAGVPDQLLEQESKWREQIASLEEAIFRADRSDGLDSTTVALNGELFEVQQAHDSLVLFLENHYPKYHRLKYERQTISVAELQTQNLAADEGVLQYFVGDSSLFLFVIGQQQFQARQIPLDFPLEKWLSDWREAVANYGTRHRSEAAAAQYLQRSRQLYEKLWPTFTDQLPQRLTIIADGVLGYLPFEALLVTTPTVAGNYRNYDYLLHHHQISYAFSATWWQAQKAQNPSAKPSSGLLAMAPHFAGPQAQSTRSTPLGALYHNQEEAQAIAQLWDGDAYTGSEATEAKFRQLASQYQILHLATHAKANDKSGDYSYLAFAEIPDALDNETLYARELYELSLQADLVVLSACETGLGELQKGEGIISLARGFSYAGARSILTTLWPISDDKAAQLMIRFYEKLRDQSPKDAALRESKIEYLSACRDREAHPFYWAAFVGMGNMTAVEGGGRWPWRGVGVGLGILMILGLGWWWKIKS